MPLVPPVLLHQLTDEIRWCYCHRLATMRRVAKVLLKGASITVDMFDVTKHQLVEAGE